VIGLITSIEETAYREEVSDLAVWCRNNNHNVSKTKELIVDYKKRVTNTLPSTLMGLQWSWSRA
jgi:hypothetical protein